MSQIVQSGAIWAQRKIRKKQSLIATFECLSSHKTFEKYQPDFMNFLFFALFGPKTDPIP